jgi:hypothetical protein
MAKVKFKGITADTIIDIKVSGYFYNKIMTVLTMLGQSVTPQEFAEVINALKDDKEKTSLMELNVEILVALLTEIEKQAIEQNKVTEQEVDVPDEPSESSNSQGPQSAQ